MAIKESTRDKISTELSRSAYADIMRGRQASESVETDRVEQAVREFLHTHGRAADAHHVLVALREAGYDSSDWLAELHRLQSGSELEYFLQLVGQSSNLDLGSEQQPEPEPEPEPEPAQEPEPEPQPQPEPEPAQEQEPEQEQKQEQEQEQEPECAVALEQELPKTAEQPKMQMEVGVPDLKPKLDVGLRTVSKVTPAEGKLSLQETDEGTPSSALAQKDMTGVTGGLSISEGSPPEQKS